MNSKLIIAILVIAAMPLGFFTLRAHQVTKADAQEVLKIISGDKAKTQIYCDMTRLDEQIKQAKEKKDSKTVNELSQKLDLLEEKLGPEYVALMDGLEDIDPKSEVAQEIESVLDDLYDNLCGGS
jgi:peptidoglycan hydrolase CwlO-like protein